MGTDRRKFISLLALGVPASTSAMRKGLPFPIRHSIDENVIEQDRDRVEVVSGVSNLEQGREQMEVFCGVNNLIARAFLAQRQGKDGHIRVVRQPSSDSPVGKIRWAVEIEESDESWNTILDRHPSVLLVCGGSLQVVYGMPLEQAGCKLQYAFNNDEAMRLYQECGPYDLVLTDFGHVYKLVSRIRERNLEQAIAVVGACSATYARFNHKIPVLREGPGPQQLVRLVESAIKPRVRVLLVIAEPDASRAARRGAPELKGPTVEDYEQVWHIVTSIPESFEIELETNGKEALKRYCERGPYDLVLAEFRLPGLSGPDLAAAIRSENANQRIVMITNSRAVGSHVQQELGDIPVLNLRNPRTRAAVNRAWRSEKEKWPTEYEGKRLLDWVDAGLKRTRKKTAKSLA